MKSLKLRVATVAVSTIMLASSVGLASAAPSAAPVVDPEIAIENTAVPLNYAQPTADKKKLSAFVERLYKVCLGRKPDKEGLNSWVDMLANRQQTGASAAYGFIFSAEFQNKKCSNEEYVQYMYDAFFGRKADAAGLKTWVDLLNSGTSREAVFAGFANSAEFANLCANYGVVRGDYFEQYDWQQTAKVNLFVDRLYLSILDRNCDTAGMTSWTEILLSKKQSGAQVAYGFIFSREFLDQKLCDECYIKVLYQAFMGRAYDTAGFNTWKNLLKQGYSWEYAFNGFVGSQEFTDICATYGINRGSANFDGNHHGFAGICPKCGKEEVPSGNNNNVVNTKNYKEKEVAKNVRNTNSVDGQFIIFGFNDEFQGLVDEYSIGYDYYNITPNDGQAYEILLDTVLADGEGAPDLYVCDSDYVKKYIDDGKGNHRALTLNSLGISYSELSEMYNYTLKFAADNENVIRGLAWQACPCGVFYNRTVANATLGVSEPEDVAPYFATWDAFLNTAHTVADTGDYRIVSGWDDVYRSYLNSRKKGWIVNGRVYIDPAVDDFFTMALNLHKDDLTWETSQWSVAWSDNASNETVLSYWGPMWLGYSLGLADPEKNETAGDWGMVPAPTSWYWGGTWVMASNYCDRKADAAKVMRDICIDKTNLRKMNSKTGEFVNNIAIMTSVASSDAGKLDWLAGQNPFAILLETAKTIDNSAIGLNDSYINGYFTATVESYVNGYIGTRAEAKSEFIRSVQYAGYV